MVLEIELWNHLDREAGGSLSSNEEDGESLRGGGFFFS